MHLPDALSPIPMYSGGRELPLPPLKKGQRAWTEKEKRFRDLYLFSNNIVESYVQAGYAHEHLTTSQLISTANRHLKTERIQALLAPAYSTIEVSPESLKQAMAKRLRAMPPEEAWTWDHWLKMFKIAAQNAGMLKEVSGGMQVGTMNLINIQEQAKAKSDKYPTTAKAVRKMKEEAENPPEEVIDVSTLQ